MRRNGTSSEGRFPAIVASRVQIRHSLFANRILTCDDRWPCPNHLSSFLACRGVVLSPLPCDWNADFADCVCLYTHTDDLDKSLYHHSWNFGGFSIGVVHRVIHRPSHARPVVNPVGNLVVNPETFPSPAAAGMASSARETAFCTL